MRHALMFLTVLACLCGVLTGPLFGDGAEEGTYGSGDWQMTTSDHSVDMHNTGHATWEHGGSTKNVEYTPDVNDPSKIWCTGEHRVGGTWYRCNEGKMQTKNAAGVWVSMGCNCPSGSNGAGGLSVSGGEGGEIVPSGEGAYGHL